MSVPTVADWRERILRALGVPTSEQNLRFLTAWQIAEGGTASNNPFNTTLAYGTGWTNYNAGGVKNYPIPAQGIEATVKTLQEGGHGYEAIVADLKRSADPTETAAAVLKSEWGTRTFPTLGDVSDVPVEDPTGPLPAAGGAGCLSAVVYCLAAWTGLGAGIAGAVTVIGWLT